MPLSLRLTQMSHTHLWLIPRKILKGGRKNLGWDGRWSQNMMTKKISVIDKSLSLCVLHRAIRALRSRKKWQVWKGVSYVDERNCLIDVWICNNDSSTRSIKAATTCKQRRRICYRTIRNIYSNTERTYSQTQKKHNSACTLEVA